MAAFVAAGGGTGARAIPPSPRAPAAIGWGVSSDMSGNLTAGRAMTWFLSPAVQPSLVTVSCAAFGNNVTLAATYGGVAMATDVAYQYKPLYVGLFTLVSPAAGTQSATVVLTRATGWIYVECSATGWTGVGGVDTSIGSGNWEWGYVQSYVTIDPAAAVPAGEVFFSAMSRYEWGTGTPLNVTSTGAGAAIVDSNTGGGCQDIPNHPDVDCIATAELLSGGTSMTYTWAAYGGFAVVGGVGLVAGSAPPPGNGGTPGGGSAPSTTLLGWPDSLLVMLIVLAGVGAGLLGAFVLSAPSRARPPMY